MDDDYGYDSDNIDEENQSRDYLSSPSEEEEIQSQKESEQKSNEEEDDDDLSEDQEQIYNKDHDIIEDVNDDMEPNKERITTPFLTKYEKARILGVRAVQISKNAPLYYSPGDNQNLDPLAIAEQQLQDGKIPFIVRRYLPDGTFEDWKLSQLKRFD